VVITTQHRNICLCVYGQSSVYVACNEPRARWMLCQRLECLARGNERSRNGDAPTTSHLLLKTRWLTFARSQDEAEREDGSSTQTGLRRTARACLHCRARKQRCLPVHDDDGTVQSSCRRCRQLNTICSFEVERDTRPEATPAPSRVAEIVVELQRRCVRVIRHRDAADLRLICA
jgi:hypothetical protein